MSTGWKLFEEVKTKNGIMPGSLVHGFDIDGVRTRAYFLDRIMHREYGTPGFNFFETYDALVKYLPRFKVRRHNLVACEIEFEEIASRTHSYIRARKINIPSKSWYNRKLGLNILNPSILTTDDPGFDPGKSKLITQYDKVIRRRLSPS